MWTWLTAALARHPWLLLALVGVVLLVGLWLGLRAARWRVARRIGRHRRLGHRGEEVAEDLLRRAGFRVVERQATARVVVLVDGEPLEADVRADFLVQRRGRLFAAEAKGGLEVARVHHSATRRQLLEYACAFDVDGVLLVDAARRRIHHVRFPLLDEL